VTIVANILDLVLVGAISFALTFGTARYGESGVVAGLLGLLPLAALRSLAWARWSVRPIGGVATSFALLAINAIALSLAIVVGVPALGTLEGPAVGAGVLSILWLHAIGRGHYFWGGLAVLAIVAAVVALAEAAISSGVGDPQATFQVWWRSGWGQLAPAGVVLALVAWVVGQVSRFVSQVERVQS
jgi:hypothetical protein